jgi:flagellar basal-body rod protein FlgF
MDRLLYVAMTGAKQLMQAQTLVSHNLANISTTGFRADLARFEARPIEGPGYPSRVNTVASGLGFDRKPGPLMQTGSSLDVAVEGPGRTRAARAWTSTRSGCSRPSAASS